MRRIRWWAVVAGALVAVLALWLISPAIPNFSALVAYEDRGGVIAITTERWVLAQTLFMISLAISSLLAHLLGGVVAGRVAFTSPGLNGTLTAVLSPIFGTVALLAMPVSAFLSDPMVEWDIDFTSEDLGLLSFWVRAFAVIFPFNLLLGYLGGRLGGRLRASSRSAA